MGNRIYYLYQCDCSKDGKPVRVKIHEGQDIKDSNEIYFTCTKCNTTFAVEPDLVLPEGRIISREEKNRLGEVEEYSIEKTFLVGQTIFHPVFKEKGVILSRKEASGYAGKILVEFEKRGKMYLVEGYEK
jgi:hypothetical protein